MTSSLLDDLARRGFVSADDVRAPPTGETSARPRADEVVVFRDLFTAGLRMPLDPVVVDIFHFHDCYLARKLLGLKFGGRGCVGAKNRKDNNTLGVP